MTHDSQPVSVADKHAAHWRRYYAGQKMVELLRARDADNGEGTSADLEERRVQVWEAEGEALRLDPGLKDEPSDIPERRIDS